MQWPSLKRPIQTPKQLLVEGRTPEIFFREWVEALGLKNQVEVRDYGSLNDLIPYLRIFTSYPSFRDGVASVAIVRDAEEKPAAAAFASVCHALKEVGLSCPATAGSFSAGKPRTAVFVLPDCRNTGMLETLCWSVLQADQQLPAQLKCVAGYFDCLQKAGTQPRNEAKAKVWAFLAGKGDFDPQVGRAAQAKVWDWANPEFKLLSAFLKSL